MGDSDLKHTVHRLLDPEARETALERGTNLFLAGLIVLNVAAVVLESVETIDRRFGQELAALEAFSVAVFSAEYLLRLWTCTLDSRYRHPVAGRLRFMVTPMALIDLLAILPAYLPGAVFWDLRFIRALRLLRMLRALKIVRYSRTLQTFATVVRATRVDLGLILVFLVLVLVVSASLMYFAEHATQPRVFSSIPAAMWWAIVTLTTVGYGDIYPVTPLGKLLGSVISLVGIGLFALPAGILASRFTDELQRERRDRRCPHCGEPL